MGPAQATSFAQQRDDKAGAQVNTSGLPLRDDSPSRACEGALAILRREGLVQVMQRGQGPTLHYTFRVLKALPLLRPDQVQRLCPGLQRDHGNWLDRYGIDAALYLSAFDSASSEEPSLDARSSPSPHLPSSTTPAPGAMQSPTTAAGAFDSATGGANGGTAAAGRAESVGARSTNNLSVQEDPLKKLWQAALAELRLQLPRHDIPWRTMHTRPFSLEDGALTVHVYYPAQHDFLHHRLTRTVGRVLGEVTDGRVREVRFVLVEKTSTPAVPPPSAARQTAQHGSDVFLSGRTE